ncbi:hypothetical protein IJG21_00220 [Candidatus Saccharibacteria bacterium]|nr:hypothetical protein [Candidatus Saccharibacteria bacterium]
MRIGNEKNKVVSRAENKLAGAARAFAFDFRGKTVLDIGSSTGGFTEYALRRGAEKVIAVEKGTRQMKAPLRFDTRIELYEKTDIFNVVAKDTEGFRGFKEGGGRVGESLVIIEAPEVILADVSFISLTKVLAYAKISLARFKTDFLVMLKPQFEAEDFELNKGVVKNEKLRREIIRRFETWVKRNGFLILGKRDNELSGKNGNVERFYHLRLAKK